MLKKSRCLWSDFPIGGVLFISPHVHMATEFIDDRVRIVLLLLSGDALVHSEVQLSLVVAGFGSLLFPSALLGLGDRSDERCNAS